MMETTYAQWIGRKLVDPDGGKIGRIDEVYVDDQTGQPAWLTVHTGLLGTHTSFVPLQEAQPVGDDVQVPYSKQEVKEAPHIDPDGHLEPTEEQRLFQHYSMDGDGAGDRSAARRGADGMGRDMGRDLGRDGGRGMTRSEEELRVGKESVERGRARLRKYVVTEDVQATVPLRREEVRVEREPVTARDRDGIRGDATIAEDQQEMVLHEERPVVAKDVVPKERVRLDRQDVTEQRTIADQVRKERIDVDRPDRRPRRSL